MHVVPINEMYCIYLYIYILSARTGEIFKNGNPQKLTNVFGSMSQVGLNRSRVDDSTVQAWYIAVSFRNLNHMFGESNISLAFLFMFVQSGVERKGII